MTSKAKCVLHVESEVSILLCAHSAERGAVDDWQDKIFAQMLRSLVRHTLASHNVLQRVATTRNSRHMWCTNTYLLWDAVHGDVR